MARATRSRSPKRAAAASNDATKQGDNDGSINELLIFVVTAANVAFAWFCVRIVPTFDACNDQLVKYSVGFLLTLGAAGILQYLFLGEAAPVGKFAPAGGLKVPPVIGWMTMEQPAFVVPAVTLAVHMQSGKPLPAGAAVLGLFMLHYAQRAYVYPWLHAADSRPLPLWLNYLGAIVFCTINGSLQANDVLYGGHYADMGSLVRSPNYIGGAALFAVGMVLNIHADRTLYLCLETQLEPTFASFAAATTSTTPFPFAERRLKRELGAGNYAIPTGGLFDYVASATASHRVASRRVALRSVA